MAKSRVWLVLVGALLASAGAARADHVLAVDAKGGFGGPNGLVLLDATFGGQALQVWSGAQTARLDGGSAFDAYCVDFYHDNYVPVSYHVHLDSIRDLVSLPPGGTGPVGGHGSAVAYLYATDAAAAAGNHDQSAGLQAAIWSVEYGGGFRVTDAPSSDGVSGSDAANAAYWMNTYLADYEHNRSDARHKDATWFQAQHDGSLYQSLVGPSGSHPLAPTPEPSGLVLAGIAGAVGLGVRFLKRRRPLPPVV
jgi:hypothetical protein